MLELFILCERGVCGISFGILDNFHIEVSPKVSALIGHVYKKYTCTCTIEIIVL